MKGDGERWDKSQYEIGIKNRRRVSESIQNGTVAADGPSLQIRSRPTHGSHLFTDKIFEVRSFYSTRE